MSFQDIIEAMRASAIADFFSPTEESVFRRYCRTYSKTFHTPLHEVFELPPADVVLAVIENQIEEADVEKHTSELLEMIYRIEDPEFDAKKKREQEEFDKMVALEEEERLKKTPPTIKADIEEPPPTNEPIPQDLPKSGGINLAYLESLDSGESGSFE